MIGPSGADGTLVTSQENEALISKNSKPGTADVVCKATRVDGKREAELFGSDLLIA